MLTHAYLPFFRRLEKSPLVLQAIEILLQAIDEGQVCVAIDTLANRLEITSAVLQQTLAQSVLVSGPNGFTPFIVDQDRLYLARFWFEETQVAEQLKKKMGLMPVDVVQARKVLTALFPPSVIQPDRQKLAAALAILQRLTIISGGPGTGKTSTLTKLLVAILATQSKTLQIGFAAPTGKAASRMQTAIAQAKSMIPAQFSSLLDHIPAQASTLHRLLQINPLQREEKYPPLPFDILVVDEASMIDLPMMSRLLRSLPESARLILLGDKYQLASVEPGSVFASLCEGQGYSESVIKHIADMTDCILPSSLSHSQLSDAFIQLNHSYRFSAQGGIGALTKATLHGEAEYVLDLLSHPHEGITWLQDKPAIYTHMVEGYKAYFHAAQDLTIPIEDIFTLWEQFRVLTPLREGPEGSLALNHKITQALTGSNEQKQPWYSGRVIMITENNPGLKLYNGDIGIVRVIQEEIKIYFIDESKNIRYFTPNRLPQYETAFVMTVHKSQGSEFEHVLFYLPDRLVAVMNRALFYTAITRARTHVTLYGQSPIIQHMVTHNALRESGLAERLSKRPHIRQLRLFDD